MHPEGTKFVNKFLGVTVSPLTTTLSRLRRVAIGGNSLSGAPSSGVENFVITVGGCGRGGHGRGRDLKGGRGRGYKGSCHYIHCIQTNHVSDEFWDKFGKPEWARVNSTPSIVVSSLATLTVQISHIDYDRFLHLQAPSHLSLQIVPFITLLQV